MKLEELFSHLAFSELSQLAGIDPVTGLIKESHYDKVLSAINLGLTALHSRFFIKEEVLTVKLIGGKYTYRLHSSGTVSSGNPNAYILDTVAEPFRDTLLKVEQIYADTGYEFPLNDASHKWSIHTPSIASLLVPDAVVNGDADVPEELVTTQLKVVYRANHKVMPLGYNGYNAGLVEIDLPYNFVEALLYYVGSRLHNPMGMVNEFNAGNNYAAKYERECARIEQNNVRVDQDSQNSKLIRNGWV